MLWPYQQFAPSYGKTKWIWTASFTTRTPAAQPVWLLGLCWMSFLTASIHGIVLGKHTGVAALLQGSPTQGTECISCGLLRLGSVILPLGPPGNVNFSLSIYYYLINLNYLWMTQQPSVRVRCGGKCLGGSCSEEYCRRLASVPGETQLPKVIDCSCEKVQCLLSRR